MCAANIVELAIGPTALPHNARTVLLGALSSPRIASYCLSPPTLPDHTEADATPHSTSNTIGWPLQSWPPWGRHDEERYFPSNPGV